jgi:chromate transporter
MAAYPNHGQINFPHFTAPHRPAPLDRLMDTSPTLETSSSTAKPATLFAVYRLFFQVGLLSFGGGVTAWFHREVVLVRKWMTDDDFFSGYALAQVLPGVNSTNMAVYIGQHVRGAIGSVVALTGLLTGPLIVVIIAAIAYHRLLELPGFSAAMSGIATAAVGMIFQLGFRSARDSLRHLPSLLIFIATFVSVGLLRWPLVWVALVLVPLSIAASWQRSASEAKAADE